MDFTPHTDTEIKEMLSAAGMRDIEDLFRGIPGEIPRADLSLPEGIQEQELIKKMKETARQNVLSYDNYLGAGSYEHFIPSIVKDLSAQSGFVTSYTPYQAEAGQGTLQAMYEYQSLICALTGMDVSNASLYDGSTSLADAVLSACRIKGGHLPKVFISAAVHPEYRQVVKTYLSGTEAQIIEIPYSKNGVTDIGFLKDKIDGNTAAAVLQSPNFFGCIEPSADMPPVAAKTGALSILCANPLSLGILKPPGRMGFDISVGEGQPFGIPMSFGGPYLGYFACRKELMRRMPGRVAGRAKDNKGRRGFVLTLQAREQHIRREKAVSNICSNEALCALAACVYMCTLGKQGIRDAAELNVSASHYAADVLCRIDGVDMVFDAPFFNEFVLRMPLREEFFAQNRIVPGLPLERLYPGMDGASLWCVTETKTKEQIDRLAEVIKCG